MIRVSRSSSSRPAPTASTAKIVPKITRQGTCSRCGSAMAGKRTDPATLVRTMGQPITVSQKPTSTPGVVRFELNRSLTGMDHERYRSIDDAGGDRPPDKLARLLFERGDVDAVHIYSNEVTVDLADGASPDGMVELITSLFTHYREGVTPSIP